MPRPSFFVRYAYCFRMFCLLLRYKRPLYASFRQSRKHPVPLSFHIILIAEHISLRIFLGRIMFLVLSFYLQDSKSGL